MHLRGFPAPTPSQTAGFGRCYVEFVLSWVSLWSEGYWECFDLSWCEVSGVECSAGEFGVFAVDGGSGECARAEVEASVAAAGGGEDSDRGAVLGEDESAVDVFGVGIEMCAFAGDDAEFASSALWDFLADFPPFEVQLVFGWPGHDGRVGVHGGE